LKCGEKILKKKVGKVERLERLKRLKGWKGVERG
jgi:hypothetical protein